MVKEGKSKEGEEGGREDRQMDGRGERKEGWERICREWGGGKESGRGRQTNGGRRGWEKAGQYVVASST